MKAHRFRVADFQGIAWRWDVPDDLADGTYFELSVRLRLSAAYSGGQTTPTRVMFAVAPRIPGDPNSYVTLSKTFGTGDTELTATTWRKGKWVIGSSRFVGKEGGKIQTWFYTLSSSTGPDFLVGEPKGIWLVTGAGPGLEATEPAEGFAWAAV